MRTTSLFRVVTILLISVLILTSCNPAADLSLNAPSMTIPEERAEVTSTGAFTEMVLTPSDTKTDTPTPTQVPPTSTPIVETRLPPEQWQAWPVVPELTGREQTIYEHGINLGNDPTHFSKVGDCQAVKEAMMGIYDFPDRYTLTAQQAHLQETIDNFAGSFDRDGFAVKGGYNAAAVLSPIWADPEMCNPGETPIACEYRVHKPSIVIISLEVWWEGRTVERYEDYMRQIIEFYIDNGVVPILSTKADNVEGDHRINLATARLAYEYHIPLWNFWLAVQPLPNHGLDAERADGFHISYAAWTVRSFTALQALDAVWGSVHGGESEPESTDVTLEPGDVFAEIDFAPAQPIQPVPMETGYWLFSLVQRHGEDTRSAGIYAYNPSNSKLHQILEEGYWLEDINLESDILLVSMENQLYLSGLDGNLELLTEKFARTSRDASTFWLPDGERLLVLTDEGDGRTLWLVDPAEDNWQVLAEGDIAGIIKPSSDSVFYWYQGVCDQATPCEDNTLWRTADAKNALFAELNSAAFDTAGDYYAWVENTESNTVILYARSADQSYQDFLYLPGNRLMDLAWAPSERRLAVLTVTRSDYSGKLTDANVFIVDADTMSQVTYATFPGLNPKVKWEASGKTVLLTSTLVNDGGYQLHFRLMNLASGLYDTLDGNLTIQCEDFITIDQLFWLFP